MKQNDILKYLFYVQYIMPYILIQINEGINLLSGLCRSVRVIELLVNLPSPHSRVPARPFTCEVLRARKHAPTLFPSDVFTFGLVMSSSRSLVLCHMVFIVFPNEGVVFLLSFVMAMHYSSKFQKICYGTQLMYF
jgi:hypothetical protein